MNVGEIAKLAGVSRGTIDRVLHNRGGVRPEVAQRVLEVCKEYNYKPNRAGKALAIGKTERKIGVVLCAFNNEFFNPVLEGMRDAEQEMADFSIALTVKITKGFNAEEQIRQIDELLVEDIKAIIIMPVNDPIVIDKINQLMDKNIPVVTLNSDVKDSKRIAYVGCDYWKSGQTAGHLLGMIAQERAKVAVVVGDLSILGHKLRLQGFKDVVEKLEDVSVEKVIECNDDSITAFAELQKLLQQNSDINAFYFAASGVDGGLRAINAHYTGHRKPIIITSDETEPVVSALNEDRIQATITQQPYQQGYKSVMTVVDILINKIYPDAEELYTENEIKTKYNI